MSQPVFPPLMSGLEVTGQTDPFIKAQAEAARGVDAGLIVYNLGADKLLAAIVLAPEVPLQKAMAMLPLCAVGFQNALGALAPPEVAVHLDWSGGLRINGARAGRFRVAAATQAADVPPDWLVVGFELDLILSGAPGDAPEITALYEEGCADIEPGNLLESWSKHTLVWINRWQDEGVGPLHAEWRGLVHGLGEETRINDRTGTFLGVDEDFGLLLRHGEGTDVIPMTSLLEN